MKRIVARYHHLGAVEKLIMIFGLNFIWWILMALLLNLAWTSPYRDTPGEILVYGLWMGTIWTFLFNWKLVNAAFFGKKRADRNLPNA